MFQNARAYVLQNHKYFNIKAQVSTRTWKINTNVAKPRNYKKFAWAKGLFQRTCWKRERIMHICKLFTLVSSWFKAITASICFTLSSPLYKEEDEKLCTKNTRSNSLGSTQNLRSNLAGHFSLKSFVFLTLSKVLLLTQILIITRIRNI